MPPAPRVTSAGTGTSTNRLLSPVGATEGSVALGMQTYSDAGDGTDVVLPKIWPKFLPQSVVKNSEWCCSWGSSPLTPSMTNTAPGPDRRFCHQRSG